ncbi:MAG: IMP dehydrogenase [Candidatus Woesearchaeota archaeon]
MATIIGEGLSYADVLLVPKQTPLHSRSEANLTTRFTKHITLNIPLVSANMATVTESAMAIALAQQGGLGIIHQFGSIEEQVEHIKRVKRKTAHVVEHPHTICPESTLQEALEYMQLHDITSLLVTKDDTLLGILCKKDYEYETDLQKTVADVMTTQLHTASSVLSIAQAKEFFKTYRVEKIPIVIQKKLCGLITARDCRQAQQYPLAIKDNKGRLLVGAALGVKDALERAEQVIKAGADVLVLDIAHAHSTLVIDTLKQLKKAVSTDIMVGNIATASAAKALIEAGADGLKIGIGPSPVCSTRIVSGAGIPQLTAIMNVYEVAKQYDIPLCADGGISFSGDIVKALAAGATTIMGGSLFAGTNEAPGLIVEQQGKRYKRYMGSASYENNHMMKEKTLKQSINKRFDVYVEGISTLIELKGPVKEIINKLCKGVQSGISYGGGHTITEIQQQAEFIKITPSGWQESLTRL